MNVTETAPSIMVGHWPMVTLYSVSLSVISFLQKFSVFLLPSSLWFSPEASLHKECGDQNQVMKPWHSHRQKIMIWSFWMNEHWMEHLNVPRGDSIRLLIITCFLCHHAKEDICANSQGTGWRCFEEGAATKILKKWVHRLFVSLVAAMC